MKKVPRIPVYYYNNHNNNDDNNKSSLFSSLKASLKTYGLSSPAKKARPELALREFSAFFAKSSPEKH